MMSDLAIQVENVSKIYKINIGRSNGFKETVRNLFVKESANTQITDFRALDNISFNVRTGEVLGVIGRNGAGKSTLLKVLSRITEPTTGKIEISGRLGSLLEVGTGFHPELSGRENIFLNGSILGMRREEIRSRFDEIVEFSGVDKFIDTPVKRYSSGMYVRLAFAVAAHLEPEILIIDEVLAVGDVAFQKKCLGKMQDIAGKGRTVLFVSHNMQAVRSLCNKSIFLKNGQLIAEGPTDEVLSIYDRLLRETEFSLAADLNNEKNRRGSGEARFSNIQVKNESGNNADVFQLQEKIVLSLTFSVLENISEVYTAFGLRSGLTREFITTVRYKLPFINLQKNEEYQFELIIEANQLRPGEYPLYFWLGSKDSHAFDVVDDAIAPLIITTRLSISELGFDPSVHTGYFSLRSSINLGI